MSCGKGDLIIAPHTVKDFISNPSSTAESDNQFGHFRDSKCAFADDPQKHQMQPQRSAVPKIVWGLGGLLLVFLAGCSLIWLSWLLVPTSTTISTGNLQDSEHRKTQRILQSAEPPKLSLLLDPRSLNPQPNWPLRRIQQVVDLHIDRVELYDKNATTAIILEDGSRFIANGTLGTLYDSNSTRVGSIIFERDPIPRHLSGYNNVFQGAPPIPPPPQPVRVEGEYRAYPSEMYCRYGCGNIMGVTFPYYYRPFFGYGFPLLGTESMFPPGYGGNPVTALGAVGALGGSIPPGAALVPGGVPIM